MHERIQLRVKLPPMGDGASPGEIAVTVHLPVVRQFTARQPVLFMFPGAGYARGYFDMSFPGMPGYSEAEHHVAHGMIVAAIDHLSVGESIAREADKLTFADIAAANVAAVRDILAALREGSLAPGLPALVSPTAVGVGQSMGGHIVLTMQAHHGIFDGVAALGTSITQTRLSLRPGRRYPKRGAPAGELLRAAQQDSDMRAAFHWPEGPQAMVDADMSASAAPPWRSPTIPASAGRLMEPAIIAWEAASIRVPVLLIYGEIDVTPDPLADVAAFRSTNDISLLIIDDMAHMHNFAPTRQRAWVRLGRFARALAE